MILVLPGSFQAIIASCFQHLAPDVDILHRENQHLAPDVEILRRENQHLEPDVEILGRENQHLVPDVEICKITPCFLYAALHCVGVFPVRALKKRTKCCGYSKPSRWLFCVLQCISLKRKSATKISIIFRNAKSCVRNV